MSLLSYQHLDVYKTAMSFALVCDQIAQAIPKGRPHLRDQLQRASTSVTFNVAEGAGEMSPKDKARFYRMAKRSATESAAIVDLTARLQLVPKMQTDEAQRLAVRVVQMLTKLGRRFDPESEARVADSDPDPDPDSGRNNE